MYITESDYQPGIYFLMAGDTEDTTLLKTRHRARAEAYQAALAPFAAELRRMLELAARIRSRGRYLTDDWEDDKERSRLRAEAAQVRDLLMQVLGPAREEAGLPTITAGQVARWMW